MPALQIRTMGSLMIEAIQLHYGKFGINNLETQTKEEKSQDVSELVHQNELFL